jgi:exopolysaccharide biosynthesis polyprenyl glycosylphosphotransferase
LESNGFDVLAFDSTNRCLSDEEIRRILQVKYRNKAIYDLPSLYKNLTGKVPLSFIDGQWLLTRDGLQGQANAAYARAKRILDITLSGLLIMLLAPLLIIIAIAISLDSKGKIFFVQERLGLERKPFGCFKFRTMVKGAESQSGPVWSSEGDPRITRVGRILRSCRLDELPQLWNILHGDMSFVGPRPIREYFAEQLAEKIPFYGLRFSVKPGLTGWAQVNYDYAGSEEGQLEKFQYELFYIQNMSLFLDLLTVFKTVGKVFERDGR